MTRGSAGSALLYGSFSFGNWRNETSINECIVLVVSHLPAVPPSISVTCHRSAFVVFLTPSHTPSYKYLPPPLPSSNANDAGGSVHDSSWADLFMEKVGRGGRSRSASESLEPNPEGSDTDDNATPSRPEKMKSSGSMNNLLRLV